MIIFTFYLGKIQVIIFNSFASIRYQDSYRIEENTNSVLILLHIFSFKGNSIFHLRLKLLTDFAKKRLKVAQQLLIVVASFHTIQRKQAVSVEKVRSEAGQLLRSCLNFGQNLRLKTELPIKLCITSPSVGFDPRTFQLRIQRSNRLSRGTKSQSYIVDVFSSGHLANALTTLFSQSALFQEKIEAKFSLLLCAERLMLFLILSTVLKIRSNFVKQQGFVHFISH